MDFKKIKELIKLVDQTNISELQIESEEFKITLKTKAYTEAMQQKNVASTQPIMMPPSFAPYPSTVPPPPATNQSTVTPTQETPKTETPAVANEEDKLITVKSPMIGTFYRSAAPDKPPYIKIGDTVTKGTVVCIIEAMKLFNEIEAEVSGRIVKVLVDDSSPVEYDQPLFLVEPT